MYIHLSLCHVYCFLLVVNTTVINLFKREVLQDFQIIEYIFGSESSCREVVKFYLFFIMSVICNDEIYYEKLNCY